MFEYCLYHEHTGRKFFVFLSPLNLMEISFFFSFFSVNQYEKTFTLLSIQCAMLPKLPIRCDHISNYFAGTYYVWPSHFGMFKQTHAQRITSRKWLNRHVFTILLFLLSPERNEMREKKNEYKNTNKQFYLDILFNRGSQSLFNMRVLWSMVEFHSQ